MLPDFDLVVQSLQGTATYAEQERVEMPRRRDARDLANRTVGQTVEEVACLVQLCKYLSSQVLASLEVITTAVPDPSQPLFEKVSLANGLLDGRNSFGPKACKIGLAEVTIPFLFYFRECFFRSGFRHVSPFLPEEG